MNFLSYASLIPRLMACGTKESALKVLSPLIKDLCGGLKGDRIVIDSAGARIEYEDGRIERLETEEAKKESAKALASA